MIILTKERRLKAAFNMGARLEIHYNDEGVSSWIPYGGKDFPLEDLDDIRIDTSLKYVVLDSVIKGLTYGIFPSEVLTKFIKPYYVGTFDKCFDWVLANTKWNGKIEKLFERTYINPSEKVKPTVDWVVYECGDFWHSTIEPNYDCIKHKPGVEMICKGSKEKCEKKAEEHNSKFYVKLEDEDCAVYKDDIGLYHIESIHKLIVDEDYKQVYTGSYKECKAFIDGTSINLANSWHVIIDECGEYEILCGKREPNILVVYEGNAQDCYDFTRRFKCWEKPLASFVARLEKENIPVDINEISVRMLKNLARLINGLGFESKDFTNCPIMRLLQHVYIQTNCENWKYTVPTEEC